jgi:hypothetical protein
MKPEEIIALVKTDEKTAATQLNELVGKLTEFETRARGTADLEKQLQTIKAQHDAASAKLSVYGEITPETALEMQTTLQKYKELGDIDTVVGYKKTVTELADLTKKQLEQYQRTLQGKESELTETKTQATQLNDQLALLQSKFEQQRIEDQKRIEALEKENADAKKQAAKAKVDSTLMSLLSEIGVMKELIPGALSLWASKAPKLDANGNVVLVSDNKQHILLQDAIKEWAESGEGKAYRAAPINTGGVSPQETQKISLTDESTSKYKYPDGKSWNLSAIIAGAKNNDPVAIEMMGQYKKNPAVAGSIFTGAVTGSLFN